MPSIACTLIRRLAPVLAPALVVATLGCGEDAGSPTAPAPGPALDVAPALALSFRQVSAGGLHTCGVTSDDRAYCWGYNNSGQLGVGTDTGPGLLSIVGLQHSASRRVRGARTFGR